MARESHSDLFIEYLNPEVQEVLSEIEEEMDCKILKINNTIYLLPNYDNSLLGFRNKDHREWIGANARLSDVYLSYYITMFILYKFYGGKNKNPKQMEFIRIMSLIDELDQRFEAILKRDSEEVMAEEEELNINDQHCRSLEPKFPMKTGNGRRNTERCSGSAICSSRKN